ncbi:MAG: hypothetical protein AB2L07_10065 [Thermoanaerobaculaceae bacterium]
MLHATARAIAARGAWPRTAEELETLPGIGPYSAAAVASFCFGGSEPPVDGNVARVAARFGRLALPLGSARLLAAGRELAAALHAAGPTPEVFEALMELGATHCAPATPRCLLCPLRPGCEAARHGDQDLYPLPRQQRAAEPHRWVVLWLEREDRARVAVRGAGAAARRALAAAAVRPRRRRRPGVRRGRPRRRPRPRRRTACRAPRSPTGSPTGRSPCIPSSAPRNRASRSPPPTIAGPTPLRPGLPTSSLLAKLARACRAAFQEV